MQPEFTNEIRRNKKVSSTRNENMLYWDLIWPATESPAGRSSVPCPPLRSPRTTTFKNPVRSRVLHATHTPQTESTITSAVCATIYSAMCVHAA